MNDQIIKNIKERIKRKTEKVFKGSGKIIKRTYSELLYGIMASRDVKLTSISKN